MGLIHWPRLINFLLIAAGALILGVRAASDIAPAVPGTQTILEPGQTRTFVSTHIVTRKVKGRIIHVDDRVYVTVPFIRVHVDHRTITVQAQTLPLRSAQATVAHPLVTVYIPVPETIYVPTTVTTTETVQLPPSTTTITVPTTITLPLIPTTSDRSDQ